MKLCYGCGQTKPRTIFTKRKASKDGLNARCRECTRKATKRHYENNKEYYQKKARRNEVKYKQEFEELMRVVKDVPCMDCEREFHSCQMDFDHREGEDKKYNVSDMKGMSLLEVKKEIAKCDVVCSNCHRMRTFLRRIKHAPVCPLATNQLKG